MENDTFTLRPTDEFIELVKLLKIMQVAQSGAHASILVEDGMVMVNGVQEFRKRNKLRAGDVVEVEGAKITIAAAE